MTPSSIPDTAKPPRSARNARRIHSCWGISPGTPISPPRRAVCATPIGRLAFPGLVGAQAVLPLHTQVFHDALDQFLGLAQFICNDLDVHRGLGGIALAVAIHAVLPDEHHGV